MTVRVLLFAQARDLAGSESLEIDLPEGAVLSDLKQTLLTRAPELLPIAGSLLFAVNNDYASENSPLPHQAEIACFPPVSGG